MSKIAAVVLFTFIGTRTYSQYISFNTDDKFRSSYCNASNPDPAGKEVRLMYANSGAAVQFVNDVVIFNTNTLFSAWDIHSKKVSNYKVINTSRGLPHYYDLKRPHGKIIYSEGSYSDARYFPLINGHKPLLLYYGGDSIINFPLQDSYWASVENLDNNTVYLNNSAYFYDTDCFYDVKQQLFFSHKDNGLKPLNTGDILGDYGAGEPMESKKGQYITEFFTKPWVEPNSFYFDANSRFQISKMKISSGAINRKRSNLRTTSLPELELPGSGSAYEHRLFNAAINYPRLFIVYKATPKHMGADKAMQRHFVELDLEEGKIVQHIQADEVNDAQTYRDLQSPWHFLATSTARKQQIAYIEDVQPFTLTTQDQQQFTCTKQHKYSMPVVLTGTVTLTTGTGKSVKLFLRENEQYLLAATVNKLGNYAAVIIGTKGSDPAFKQIQPLKYLPIYFASYYLINLIDGTAKPLYDESMYNDFQQQIKNLAPLNPEKIIMYEKM